MGFLCLGLNGLRLPDPCNCSVSIPLFQRRSLAPSQLAKRKPEGRPSDDEDWQPRAVVSFCPQGDREGGDAEVIEGHKGTERNPALGVWGLHVMNLIISRGLCQYKLLMSTYYM